MFLHQLVLEPSGQGLQLLFGKGAGLLLPALVHLLPLVTVGTDLQGVGAKGSLAREPVPRGSLTADLVQHYKACT